jgi:integrase
LEKLGLKYTTFDRKNGIYLYQRDVPSDAIWLIQKTKITNSLGKTPDEARTKYWPIHNKWEAAMQRAIASVRGEPEEDAFMDRAVEFLNAQAALNGGTLREVDWCLNWGERDRLWTCWQEWNAVHHGARTGTQFDADNLDILDRLVEGWKFYRAAFKARINLSAQLPIELPNATIPTKDGQIIMGLTDLEKKWLGEKKRRASNAGDMRQMVEMFVALNGNLPIHEIAAVHRMALREAVQQLPVKNQTKDKKMRTFQALGSYAEGLGIVTVNPLRFRPFGITEEVVRESFTDDHLRMIFKSEAWAKRSRKYRDFIRWFFVIGAYTGARIGEIAQLRGSDVYQHHGVWVIRMVFDEKEGRTSKTKQTKLVPVANALIQYGFLKFAQSCGHGQLFPEIKPNSDGQWSARVSPNISKLLRGVGLPEQYVAHGFRHTFTTRLRGKVEDSVLRRITHPKGKGRSVWENYGEVEMAEMQAAVNKLVYRVEWPRD